MTDVLVVAELLDGRSRKVTLSAIAAAKQIATGTSGAFDVLAVGDGAKAAAEELAGYGARKVLWAEVPGGYVTEKIVPTIVECAKRGYGVVVATGTAFAKDALPRVAARLEAGIAPDVTAVRIEGGSPRYVRPMYAGNVFGELAVKTPVHVVSVRQSDFEAAAPVGTASPIESVQAGAPSSTAVEFVKLETVKRERPDLAEADIVVSGGRSLKSAENFKAVLEPLVDALGAAMGASRAACDAGYVSNDLQVGQTGKVVAPKLYVAVGISGAIQHLAGMKSSKVIVAINKDKEAPIAQIADYFLVEDLFKAVPALTEEIKKLRAQ